MSAKPHVPAILFESSMPSVCRASTVYFDNVADLDRRTWRNRKDYSYGREGTPTSNELEDQLAAIEGASFALVAPSGLAAFSIACIGLLKHGDRVAIPSNGYGTGSQMVEAILSRFGVQSSIYEPSEPDSWSDTIPRGTNLLWMEAPGSITMEVPDVRRLVQHAKAIGAVTGVDNTYSAGLHFKPFKAGIDISMQALTKFQSGGADVVMGSLACVDPSIFQRLQETRHFLGMNVSPDDCYLVLRGLPTMSLRHQRSNASADVVARWFLHRDGVHSVLHAPLDTGTSNRHWKDNFTSAAGLFSVALSDRVSTDQVRAFVEALNRFRIGYSWGGPTSLVMPYDTSHPAVQRLRRLGNPVGSVVRFWIGLEEPSALLDDVQSAWSAIQTDQ